ncbi:MAG: MFS transporter [Dehalococcoidia bacterium]
MAGPIMAGVAGGMPGAPMGPGGSSRPSLRKAMVVFQYKYFRYLWFSSVLSFTGMQMQQIARALLAWHLTGSFGAVGLISLSFGLPMLLFSLIGGALSDRMEKRNLVLFTQVMNAVLAIAHAVPVATGTMSIELLFVLGLVQGTGFALGMPARTPLMAEAVGQQNMMSAIAMSNAAMNATRLFGPALAGAMIGVWGIESAYYAQAVLNTLSAVILIGVPTGLAVKMGARPFQRPGRGNMFVEIGHGLRYTVSQPRLRLLMAMMFIVSLFAMPYVMLLAGFVTDDLGRSDQDFGLLQSISGAGAIVASIAVASMTESDRKPLLQWIAGIAGGLSLVALAVGSELFGFTGAIVAIVLLGLTLTAYQTLNNTMLMDEAEPEYYGRVMSVNMLSFSVMPLMALPLGMVADWLGATTLFTILGLLVVLFTLLSGVMNPGYTFSRQEPRPERPMPPWAADAPREGAPALDGAPPAMPGAGAAGSPGGGA